MPNSIPETAAHRRERYFRSIARTNLQAQARALDFHHGSQAPFPFSIFRALADPLQLSSMAASRFQNVAAYNTNTQAEISIELNKGTQVDIYRNPMYEDSRQTGSRVVNNQIYEGVDN